MLYYLDRLSEHATSDFFKAFNVFQYVTFRAVGAALTAFVLSLAFGNLLTRIFL
jgi:phospho-N-acetylmuramoyl-pentapeptide-transferase